jgi:hypothetical protein
VAYGDTRTGPWGTGDNAAQAIHGAVVDDIFANDGRIDAVIFTGDAVMSNFDLWKKCYWRCFLNQSNRFRKSQIPFYPALGNHEVLPRILPLLKARGSVPARLGSREVPNQDRSKGISQAYDAGEALAVPRLQPETAPIVAEVDASKKQDRAMLKQWEQGVNKQDTNSAHLFAQFQGHVQANYYAGKTDDRCDSDAGLFNDDYLHIAKYGYLRPLLKGRSYYSTTVAKNGLRLKLIALDTNCLDSLAQKTFFTNEVTQFDGPIIVFGHHPPVDYS